MIRYISPQAAAALNASVVRLGLMAQFELASGTLYMTDLPYDVNYQGNVLRGGGTLVGVDTIKDTDSLEATGVKFTLSGVSPASVALVLGEHIQGRPCSLHTLFFNAENEIIASALEWSGRMDQLKLEEGESSVTVTLTSESRIADFKRAYVRRYTHEDHQIDHAGDMFFEHVQRSVEREIVWPTRHWYLDYGVD